MNASAEYLVTRPPGESTRTLHKCGCPDGRHGVPVSDEATESLADLVLALLTISRSDLTLHTCVPGALSAGGAEW